MNIQKSILAWYRKKLFGFASATLLFRLKPFGIILPTLIFPSGIIMLKASKPSGIWGRIITYTRQLLFFRLAHWEELVVFLLQTLDYKPPRRNLITYLKSHGWLMGSILCGAIRNIILFQKVYKKLEKNWKVTLSFLKEKAFFNKFTFLKQNALGVL